MLIPHYTTRVKTVRVSGIYIKFLAFLVVIATILSSLVLFIKHTVEENIMLKNEIAVLYALNFDQKDMLVDQNRMINVERNELQKLSQAVKERDHFINYKINEALGKYKEMTETYIAKRIDMSLASRSSDRTNNPFASDIRELRSLLSELDGLYQFEHDEKYDLSQSTTQLEDYLSCIPTYKPSKGDICSGFGYRIHPITRKREFHKGVDIAGPYGADIYAAGDGEVVYRGYYGGYGNALIIDHGFGVSSLYAHASRLIASKGEKVKRGQLIAKVGTSGISTGAHLHFEVRIYNNPVDPIEFLEE